MRAILLIWLVCAGVCSARDFVWLGQWQQTITCSTTQATNSWDDLIEGFEDSDGYDVTWTNIGTTANITAGADSSSLTSGKAPGQCDKAWKLTVPSDGTETYSYWNNGSVIDLDTVQTTVTFNLYVETQPSNGKNFQFYSYRNSINPSSILGALLAVSAGGVMSVQPIGTGGAAKTITAGKWHTLVFTYDTAAAADGSKMDIFAEGSLVASDNFTRAAGDLQYLFIGTTTFLDAADDGVIWFDLVSVKTN